MAQGKFVAYYRVSTQKQGASGLGLEAQRAAVASYLNGGAWSLVEEFQEVETGKGADALAKRPQLRAALDASKRHGAALIIAKLDRLARNVHFVSGLLETGVNFVAADMSQRQVVDALNASGVKTAQGGIWRLEQLQRGLRRLTCQT